MRVLVTGGAGFIGSHLVDALLLRGHAVRVYDVLDRQVHPGGRLPDYVDDRAEFVHGDVRDRARLEQALSGVDAVYHLAALVGVGQSMYDIRRYVEGNSVGAATLLDILANQRHCVRRLIVASSMSIYGEGAYRCAEHGMQSPGLREKRQLEAHEWELKCPACGRAMEPVPTPEDKPLEPTSVYAVTKRDHEELFLAVGRSYGIPTVALRFFNVYGSRQALSNPYTGVLAIFGSRLLAGHCPVIYEDGAQSRDFVHVKDIVAANLLALENDAAAFGVFNVGTGRRTSIAEVSRLYQERLGIQAAEDVRRQFREGDIRHCYADLTRAREILGYQPEVKLERGMDELVEWVAAQTAVDSFDFAARELCARGLLN